MGSLLPKERLWVHWIWNTNVKPLLQNNLGLPIVRIWSILKGYSFIIIANSKWISENETNYETKWGSFSPKEDGKCAEYWDQR